LNGVKEPVRWGMITRAEIELDGRTAILSQDGKKIRLEVTTYDESEKFEIVSAEPPTEAENQNRGHRMLVITAMPKYERGQLGIRVVMRPEPE